MHEVTLSRLRDLIEDPEISGAPPPWEELSAKKEAASEVIAHFHLSTGAREFEVEGVGTITSYMGSSTRFDKAKMGLYLVERGVSSALVGAAIKYATEQKFNNKVTVRYKAK